MWRIRESEKGGFCFCFYNVLACLAVGTFSDLSEVRDGVGLDLVLVLEILPSCMDE